MKPFEASVLAGLGKIEAGKILLAAVSGGADSVAMLAALVSLRSEELSRSGSGFILHCVHIEHGIRPESESRGDALAVKALCRELKVPCRVISIPQGKITAFASHGGPGIEAAARMFRLRILFREASRLSAEWILTAHTRDDKTENLLMRILKGSGPAGLAAMPRSRGRFLRPLLDLTRKDVLTYLKEKGLCYRTDSTNGDLRYLRNRVRHKLVPLLDDCFPSWQGTLLALAETQSLAADFIAGETNKRLPWQMGDDKSRGSKVTLRLAEEDFLNTPAILREEAIFTGADMLAEFLSKKGRGNTLRCTCVPRRSVVRETVFKAEQEAGGGGPQNLGDLGPVKLKRENGFIAMEAAGRFRGERGFLLLIKEAGFYTLKGSDCGFEKGMDLHIRVIEAGNEEIPDRENSSFAVALPLVFRNYQKGDRIVRGGHKRIFSGIITACDTGGTAAIIGIGKDKDLKTLSRDVSPQGTACLDYVCFLGFR